MRSGNVNKTTHFAEVLGKLPKSSPGRNCVHLQLKSLNAMRLSESNWSVVKGRENWESGYRHLKGSPVNISFGKRHRPDSTTCKSVVSVSGSPCFTSTAEDGQFKLPTPVVLGFQSTAVLLGLANPGNVRWLEICGLLYWRPLYRTKSSSLGSIWFFEPVSSRRPHPSGTQRLFF